MILLAFAAVSFLVVLVLKIVSFTLATLIRLCIAILTLLLSLVTMTPTRRKSVRRTVTRYQARKATRRK